MTLHDLIDAIRAAIEPDAPATARAAGIDACRTILSALGAASGESLAAAPTSPSPIAAVVARLRGVPPDQLLDLAIAKLRAALPAGADAPAVTPLRFHIVPVAGSRGGS
jgi:hypothetical protein